MTSNQAPRVLQSEVVRRKYPSVAEMENIKSKNVINSVTQVRKKVGKTICSVTVINNNKYTK